MKNFTENTFWAKTKEDKWENPSFFDQLQKTFAAKSLASKKTESGDSMEKKAGNKKKGKDLKIIDPKSAQNLGNSVLVKSAHHWVYRSVHLIDVRQSMVVASQCGLASVENCHETSLVTKAHFLWRHEGFLFWNTGIELCFQAKFAFCFWKSL